MQNLVIHVHPVSLLEPLNENWTGHISLKHQSTSYIKFTWVTHRLEHYSHCCQEHHRVIHTVLHHEMTLGFHLSRGTPTQRTLNPGPSVMQLNVGNRADAGQFKVKKSVLLKCTRQWPAPSHEDHEKFPRQRSGEATMEGCVIEQQRAAGRSVFNITVGVKATAFSTGHGSERL